MAEPVLSRGRLLLEAALREPDPDLAKTAPEAYAARVALRGSLLGAVNDAQLRVYRMGRSRPDPDSARRIRVATAGLITADDWGEVVVPAEAT